MCFKKKTSRTHSSKCTNAGTTVIFHKGIASKMLMHKCRQIRHFLPNRASPETFWPHLVCFCLWNRQDINKERFIPIWKSVRIHICTEVRAVNSLRQSRSKHACENWKWCPQGEDTNIKVGRTANLMRLTQPILCKKKNYIMRGRRGKGVGALQLHAILNGSMQLQQVHLSNACTSQKANFLTSRGCFTGVKQTVCNSSNSGLGCWFPVLWNNVILVAVTGKDLSQAEQKWVP